MKSRVERLCMIALVAASLAGCDGAAGAPRSGAASNGSPAPSAASSPLPSAASPADPPSPDRITGELVQKLTGFPEPLSARTVTTPSGLVEGTVVFERELVASHGFVPFRVFVCDGPCTLAVVARLRGTPAVQESKLEVRDGRAGTTTTFSMMLGGAGVATNAPAPRRYSLIVLLDLPPGDVDVNPASRKLLLDGNPPAIAAAVHRGLDPLLFP